MFRGGQQKGRVPTKKGKRAGDYGNLQKLLIKGGGGGGKEEKGASGESRVVLLFLDPNGG